MSKNTPALDALPPEAAQALRGLGENLAIARLRRRESQREWAGRLGCSVPTLIRIERGDPAVGTGLYATALWLIGRVGGLPALAAPAEDAAALEGNIREVLERRAARSAASARARLARGRREKGQG